MLYFTREKLLLLYEYMGKAARKINTFCYFWQKLLREVIFAKIYEDLCKMLLYKVDVNHYSKLWDVINIKKFRERTPGRTFC